MKQGPVIPPNVPCFAEAVDSQLGIGWLVQRRVCVPKRYLQPKNLS